MRKYGDWRFNCWPSGATFFSRRLNIGVYLAHWVFPKMFVLPGSAHCLGGTVNWEIGPLRVTWVRADDWEVVE